MARNDEIPEPFAIGREVAAAAAAERRHRDTDQSPSPLEGIGYASRHHDLARFVSADADEVVRAVVDRFWHAEADARNAIRSSLTMGDFSTVLTFARRSAVSALRADDAEPAAEAVRAIALIDSERIDWRDIVWALGLTTYVLRRLSPGSDGVLLETIDRSEPQVGAMVRRFVRVSDEDAALATWGFMLVDTVDGIGVIERGIADYAPTTDLTGIALQVADVLDGDVYEVSSISAATELAPVWLPGGRPDESEPVVARARGCVTIGARLAPGEHERADAQQLSVFLLEAATLADAQRLNAWSAAPASHRSIAVQHGPLVCLVIARSFIEDVDAFETETSLSRFFEPLDSIVSGAAGAV